MRAEFGLVDSLREALQEELVRERVGLVKALHLVLVDVVLHLHAVLLALLELLAEVVLLFLLLVARTFVVAATGGSRLPLAAHLRQLALALRVQLPLLPGAVVNEAAAARSIRLEVLPPQRALP